MIPKDSPLFATAANLQQGDMVMFSGAVEPEVFDFDKNKTQHDFIYGPIFPTHFTKLNKLPPDTSVALSFRQLPEAERTKADGIDEKIPRTDAEIQAITWAKAMVAQLRREANGMKKEDAARNTIWIDHLTWDTLNRDLKESLMMGVGVYFMDLNNQKSPHGVIKSFSNGEILCEMSDITNVVIRK